MDALGCVEAVLNYLVPTGEKPVTYAHEPPPGVPRQTGVWEGRALLIHNARTETLGFSPDREGFALVRHRSAVRDFYDDDEVRGVYYPEAKRLIADALGAARVVVFDHTVRRRAPRRRASRCRACTWTTP